MTDTFWQTLSDTVHRAVNLRVITVLGDAQITGTLEQLHVSSPPAQAPSLVTDINVVGGDITTIVSEKLHGPDFADLRAGHAASIVQAQAILERNVNILVTLFKALGDRIDDIPAPSAGPSRTTPSAGNA